MQLASGSDIKLCDFRQFIKLDSVFCVKFSTTLLGPREARECLGRAWHVLC